MRTSCVSLMRRRASGRKLSSNTFVANGACWDTSMSTAMKQLQPLAISAAVTPAFPEKISQNWAEAGVSRTFGVPGIGAGFSKTGGRETAGGVSCTLGVRDTWRSADLRRLTSGRASRAAPYSLRAWAHEWGAPHSKHLCFQRRPLPCEHPTEEL